MAYDTRHAGKMTGDPKRCYCWTLRLPHGHSTDDHLKLVAEDKGKVRR